MEYKIDYYQKLFDKESFIKYKKDFSNLINVEKRNIINIVKIKIKKDLENIKNGFK
jgi:hypothetical protein